jgi:hypothetical protein
MNYFLVIFIDFFIFLNSNLNFGAGSYRWVPLPYPAVGAVTAVSRAVTSGKKTLLTGRVHLTGTSGTWSVGTHGYPCLSGPERSAAEKSRRRLRGEAKLCVT